MSYAEIMDGSRRLEAGGRASRQAPRVRAIWAAILLVLFGAACYEVAVAIGWIALGSEPGQGPPGEHAVLFAALSVSLIASLLCWIAGSCLWARDRRLELLVAPSGAAFMTARFYTFDPYYLPTLRRMSDGGVVIKPWIFTLVVLALLAAVVTRLRPALGLRLSGALLVVFAGTALFEATGH